MESKSYNEEKNALMSLSKVLLHTNVFRNLKSPVEIDLNLAL